MLNSIAGKAGVGAAVVASGCPVYFEDCIFRALSVAPEPAPAEAGGLVYGAFAAEGLNASLAFQICNFKVADIRSEHLITARGGAAVYSDDFVHTVRR